MKQYIPLILFLIFFPYTPGNCDSVIPEVDWYHLYGGAYSESGVSITKSSDGGYFIVGSSTDRDPWWDIYVLKTDELGNEIWNNTYGNLLETEQAYDHVLTENGSIVIVGIKDIDLAPKKNVLVVKISKDGDLLWNQTYGSIGKEEGTSIIKSSEGGFILTGYQIGMNHRGTDIIVMKIDDNGNHLWNSTIEQIGYEIGESIIESSNGGYIITGSLSRPELESDLYLVKINNTGSVLWNRTFGDSGYNLTYRLYPQDQGYFVGEDDDGNLVVMGQTQSFGASSLDILVLKLDSEGNLIWKKLLGGEDQDGIGNGVIIKDGFLVVGGTNSFGAGINDDVLIYKLFSNGSINWMMTFGDKLIEKGSDVIKGDSNEIVVVGYTESYGARERDVLLIKIIEEEIIEPDPEPQPEPEPEESLQEKYDLLLENYEELQSSVVDRQEEIENLQSQISSLESEITLLYNQIEELESKQSGIPGFPISAIILGVILILLMSKRFHL